MPQKVIIDADPGIGDATAIGLALTDPELDVLAITATPGCVSGEEATRNVQAVVESLDPPKWPRVGCSATALTNQWSAAAGALDPRRLNGRTGLGDVAIDVADLHHRHESAKLITDLVKNHPNEITLLTLGPLSNVQIAVELASETLDLLRGMVCLAGSIEVGGDVTAAAEFNAFANPEAARSVLRSPATKTLVPRDVSGRVVLTFEQFDRLPRSGHSPFCRLLDQMIPFALRAHHELLGREGWPLHEVVACAALSRPHLFTTDAMALDVETSGELTRGMTVFDRRDSHRWRTNIDVHTSVDAQGVLDYFHEMVANASR